MGSRVADIMVLIGQALWREVVTYWYSWPHEYVVVKRGGQEALLAAFCARIAAGEGVECRFFAQTRQYLFPGWIQVLDDDKLLGYQPGRQRLCAEPGVALPGRSSIPESRRSSKSPRVSPAAG